MNDDGVEPDSASAAGAISLELPPGRLYGVTWFVPFSFLTVGASMVIGIATGFLPRANYLAVSVLFLSLFLGALGLPLYYRSTRRLDVDNRGVRLWRGGRLHRSLAWSEIASVNLVAREQYILAFGLFRGYQLDFNSIRPGRRIAVLDVMYEVSPGTFPSIWPRIVEIARRQSIPAEYVSHLPRDW